MFAPGAGAAGQVHDFTPGVLPNGVFWTMAIPMNAFDVYRGRARLRLADIPLCDSFVFGQCSGVASQVSVNVQWNAISGRVDRGAGAAADPLTPAAFAGSFSDATCEAVVKGNQTGFSFRSPRPLDASGFFAEFGEQANGVFL